MVADNVIMTDKIGSMALYWGLPSTQVAARQSSEAALDESLVAAHIEYTKLEERHKRARDNACDGEAFEHKKTRVEQLRTQSARIKQQLQVRASSEQYMEMEEISQIALVAG
jgi:hypothetical protein